MTERTPPTGTIRNAFAKAHPFPHTTDIEERYAEFDRWLNEIRAEAWQEGAESAFYDPEIRDLVDYPENPYRPNEK